MTLQPDVPYNLAQTLARLGHISLERIRMQPPPGSATEADLLRRENRWCELIDGILVETATMGWIQSLLAAEIIRILGNYVSEHRVGLVFAPDLQTRTQPGNVRMPDASYYSWTRFPSGQIPDEKIASLTADLAVEILSESNTADEMLRKRQEYFASGCRVVWEFEPELRLVRVYTSATDFTTLTVRDTLTGDPVLPGFSLSLADLFTLPQAPSQGTNP